MAVCRHYSEWQKIQAINPGLRGALLCYKSELMIPFLLSFLICLGAFFRSRYSLSLEILALRQQLGLALGC